MRESHFTIHRHLYLQAVVLTKLHRIASESDTSEDKPRVANGFAEQPREATDVADLADEAAATDAEVKGGDEVVDTTRESLSTT
ncbi:hypothetical protein NL676_029867 [Syzygium grande]|nr:hypothetical protein NL676_029867 [Syzygium grande]